METNARAKWRCAFCSVQREARTLVNCYVFLSLLNSRLIANIVKNTPDNVAMPAIATIVKDIDDSDILG